jgi:hypothetical protein
MNVTRKSSKIILLGVLLLVIATIAFVLTNKAQSIYHISSRECFFADDTAGSDLAGSIKKAMEISQAGENKGYGHGVSVTQKNGGSSTTALSEKSSNNYMLTDTDKENLRKYLLEVNENRHTGIILSEDILYIVYIEKEKNQSFRFVVRPVYFSVSSSDELSGLFTFRKNPEDVVPKELIRDHGNSPNSVYSICFHRFIEPTICFQYSLQEETIRPCSRVRRIDIDEVETEINAETANYWARTYLTSMPYNKDYSEYVDNLTLSVSDNVSEIRGNWYIYDITILEKSTDYIHLPEKGQIKAKSAFSVNQEIESFEYTTEVVTPNIYKAPSYTLNFKVSIR